VVGPAVGQRRSFLELNRRVVEAEEGGGVALLDCTKDLKEKLGVRVHHSSFVAASLK
jgi:hypothetical protein